MKDEIYTLVECVSLKNNTYAEVIGLYANKEDADKAFAEEREWLRSQNEDWNESMKNTDEKFFITDDAQFIELKLEKHLVFD